MRVEDLVREHYRRDDLEQVVLGALRQAGIDVDALRVDDLAGLDQLHAGFLPAAEYLLSALDVGPDTELLDVGCGVGGPARVAAHRHACEVTGIDLSEDFVDLARKLTARVGLAHAVRFDRGSAADLPYGDSSFDRAMMNHVGMNIPDKTRVFAEVRRVLSDGGSFALYEQMRTGDGDLTYPLPWADNEATSFVETREVYAEMLVAAGFRIDREEDRTAAVLASGPPSPGTLTPGDLFGPAFAERMRNNVAAAMSGTLSPVLMVARVV